MLYKYNCQGYISTDKEDNLPVIVKILNAANGENNREKNKTHNVGGSYGIKHIHKLVSEPENKFLFWAYFK